MAETDSRSRERCNMGSRGAGSIHTAHCASNQQVTSRADTCSIGTALEQQLLQQSCPRSLSVGMESVTARRPTGQHDRSVTAGRTRLVPAAPLGPEVQGRPVGGRSAAGSPVLHSVRVLAHPVSFLCPPVWPVCPNRVCLCLSCARSMCPCPCRVLLYLLQVLCTSSLQCLSCLPVRLCPARPALHPPPQGHSVLDTGH